MKRILRIIVVCLTCLTLAGGVGIPASIPGGSYGGVVVTNVQAKQKMDKKFKKAMDEYLKFYKKYCKFMKKYQKSTNVYAMMDDYTKLIKQQAKVDKAFKKWKKKKMNKTELAYYAKINSKVLKMLSEV